MLSAGTGIGIFLEDRGESGTHQVQDGTISVKGVM